MARLTAYQRAIHLLRQHGPMTPADFAAAMWPTALRYVNEVSFYTDAGKFLTGMERRGLVWKNGRKYDVKM